MGVMDADSRKPPLPAPTESWADNNSTINPTDAATDISRRTDRTSYSIPEDGSPLVISKRRLQLDKSGGAGAHSQTSLLIEYYEGAKSGDKNPRPSVRLRVTPSSKKVKNSDSVKITAETGEDRKPSYTKRISLGKSHESQASFGTEISNSSGSNFSGHPPIEVEILKNSSDLSSHDASQSRIAPMPSDISSMPTDSMLEGPVAFKSPERRTSRGFERETAKDSGKDTLKTPSRRRSRSLSRERIAHKVIEKLNSDRHAQEASGKRTPQKSSSRELSEEELKPRNKASHKHYRESDFRSGTESNLTRPRDMDSNVSGASKSSVNNPKVLQAVEDAIRRLILPEIESIKRQQSLRYDRSARDSFASESSVSRADAGRRPSKNSAEARPRPKVVLNRDDSDMLSGDSIKEKKSRRASRDSASERSTQLRSSSHERERERSHKERRRRSHDTNDEEVVASGLTMTALKSHDSRERAKERTDSRERRKRRSKVDSRTDSIAITDEEYYDRSKIPPLPMASEAVDSDLTRDSILSAESAQSEAPVFGYSDDLKTPIRSVSRGIAHAVPVPDTRSGNRTPATPSVPASRSSNKTTTALERVQTPPRDLRSPDVRSVRSNRSSDKSIRTRAMNAGLAAAGLGSAAITGMYANDRQRDKEERSPLSEKTVYRSLEKPTRHEDGHYTITEIPDITVATPKESLSKESNRRRSEHAKNPESRPVETAFRPQPEKDHISRSRDLLEDDLRESNDRSLDQFYDEQHQLNNKYRSSIEYDDLQDTGLDKSDEHPHLRNHADDSSGPGNAEQELRDLPNRRKVVGSPVQVESAVASLIEPSMLGSEPSGHLDRQHFSYQSTDSGDAPASLQGSPTKFTQATLPTQHENTSWDRWAMLKETAKARSNDSREQLPPHSAQPDDHRTTQGKGGVPGMLDAQDAKSQHSTRDIDSASDSMTNASDERYGSIPQEGGLLGYGNANSGTWQTETTKLDNKRDGFVEPRGMTPPAGLGIQPRAGESKWRQSSFERAAASSSDEGYFQGDIQREATRGSADDQEERSITPTQVKSRHEELVEPAQARSLDDLTPLSFSKPAPRLFEEVDLTRNVKGGVQEDPFISDKKARFQPEASRLYDSPGFEAATGEGVNHIQSKDVVALMDHLTVRDGHRNARDTEILVTLVRSAAEMRTSFDEMKRFIEAQTRLNMQKVDQGADRTVTKILNGPRPPIPAMPRAPPRSASTEAEDLPTKKQNIFKRALKGLSSKSTTDIARIEEMLNQLLDEVEGLKEVQLGVVQAPMSARQNSLDSYERLRAAPNPAYESEGQSGASSTTPIRSRNLALPQPIQQAQRTQPNYDIRKSYETKRVSTVMEHNDEEEDESGMRTPTQEAQRSHQHDSPQHQNVGLNEPHEMNSEAADKSRKHKSNNSSLWGIPGLSRWSKTTASSAPDNRSSLDAAGPGRRDVPYSDGSRSGSDVNVLPGNYGTYARAEDDRFQSANSLPRDQGVPRSPSPLIPSETSSANGDAKYKANRNSLTLQHPQPRQGSTRRHQNHLESQATVYPDVSVSPDSDAFGSAPSLSRFHGGVMAGSRQNTQYYGANSTSSPISNHADHSAKGTSESTSAQPHQPHQSLPPVNTSRSKYDNGPLVPPAGTYPGEDYDDDDDEWEDTAIPLSRKRSPYSPGGLLAPIEERYSMEGDRSSLGYRDSLRSNRSVRPVRHSMHSISEGGVHENKGMANVREEDEDPPYHRQDIDRSETPKLDARAAVGAGGEQVRKITGPREMPRIVSGGGGGGGTNTAAWAEELDSPITTALKGTVRRKPARKST